MGVTRWLPFSPLYGISPFPIFPSSYVPQKCFSPITSQTYITLVLPSVFVPQYPYFTYSPVPVSQSLFSPVHLFPSPNRCWPFPMRLRPLPMFPQLIHQSLCSPLLFHRSDFHSLYSPYMFHSPYVLHCMFHKHVPPTSSPVSMFVCCHNALERVRTVRQIPQPNGLGVGLFVLRCPAL